MVALLARAPNSSLMAGLRARLNNCCAIVSNIQPMLATLSTNQWYPVNSRHHAYFCPPAPSTVGDMKLLFYIVALTRSPTFSAAIWHASITTPREFSTFCGAMWGGALALRARLLTSPLLLRLFLRASASPRQNHPLHPLAPLPTRRASSRPKPAYTSPSIFGSYPGNTAFHDALPMCRDTSSPSTSRKSVVTARSRPS